MRRATFAACLACAVAGVSLAAFLAWRRRRGTTSVPGESRAARAVAPSSILKPMEVDAGQTKFFFFNHRAWGDDAPRRVPTGTSATDAVPRPTTAQGWLELGWSLNTGGVAWVKADTSSVEEVTERAAYVAGLSLDGGHARLWLLLGVALMGAEEALSDEERAALDDDAAEDLPWTATVPGVGSRLYADVCLVRAVNLTNHSDGVSWLALGRYLDVTQRIVDVGGEPQSMIECFGAALQLGGPDGILWPQFAYFCLRHSYENVVFSDTCASSRFKGVMGGLEAGVCDPVLWGALADMMMQESLRRWRAQRPVTSTVRGQVVDPLDAALKALQFDNSSSIENWRRLAAAIDDDMAYDGHFGGRTMPNGAPVSKLEVLSQAVRRFPTDAKFSAALAEIMSENDPCYASLLNTVWRHSPNKAERALNFFCACKDLTTFLFTPPAGDDGETGGQHAVSLVNLFEEAASEEPHNPSLWLKFARLANVVVVKNEYSAFPAEPTSASPPLIDRRDDIIARALLLNPTQTEAWSECLNWGVHFDRTLRINGIDIDPIAAFAVLVDRTPSDADTWYWLAAALEDVPQSHICIRDAMLSAFDCAQNAASRDYTHVPAWCFVAANSPTEDIPFEPPVVATRRGVFLQCIALSQGRDPLTWAELGCYLAKQRVGERTITVNGVDMDPVACWTRATATHPLRGPRALAMRLTALAEQMEEDDERITLELPSTHGGPTVERSLNRVELLTLAAETTHHDYKAWQNRRYTAAALRSLANFTGPDETVEVLGSHRNKDEIFALAQSIAAWRTM